MCSYSAQWTFEPNFFSLGLQNLSFFIKKLFPRQAGFHRFGALNSLQVFLEHSLLERLHIILDKTFLGAMSATTVYSRN